MDANAQTALKKFLESQRKNAVLLLDCSDRLFALESVLIHLDSRAAELLQKQREKARAENNKLREQVDSLFLTLEALVSGLPNPSN
jgi:uncharacterized protein YicC (UPF0701 family)